MFDFGGVVDGYSSDFGRTIYCGDPPADYLDAYEVMLAAQEAGRAAATPGTPAREVNAACRGPIEEAGLGEHFRHRMGHCIGMTFTDEPSIIVPGRHSLRVEDILVCEEGGGRTLNSYPTALVANG
jgi:Xaa-Pro aminopeptidase